MGGGTGVKGEDAAEADGSRVHQATALCLAAPAAALRHLSTVSGMAQWCLGLMDDLREVQPGLLQGRSRFDGGLGYCRPVVEEDAGRVVYHLGSVADDLAPRIVATVRPVPVEGEAPAGTAGCIVSLQAERPPTMDDARWQRLIAAHECEVLLIQQQLAHAADPAR